MLTEPVWPAPTFTNCYVTVGWPTPTCTNCYIAPTFKNLCWTVGWPAPTFTKCNVSRTRLTSTNMYKLLCYSRLTSTNMFKLLCVNETPWCPMHWWKDKISFQVLFCSETKTLKDAADKTQGALNHILYRHCVIFPLRLIWNKVDLKKNPGFFFLFYKSIWAAENCSTTSNVVCVWKVTEHRRVRGHCGWFHQSLLKWDSGARAVMSLLLSGQKCS